MYISFSISQNIYACIYVCVFVIVSVCDYLHGVWFACPLV